MILSTTGVIAGILWHQIIKPDSIPAIIRSYKAAEPNKPKDWVL
jgi:hypothetical protein